ncbi:hypothetical protein D6745_02510 [Candidatus Woesearchaeota archaeon]|nr:MAG: hypothetical protein D6745_02510 [Candidatus Woesearchaeota archaeon]
MIYAEEASKRLEERVAESRDFTLSLDRIYVRNADTYLDVSRTMDNNGSVLITERPGTQDLAEQIANIGSPHTINLIDVGVFEGGTLKVVCDLLQRQGNVINAVTVAVLNSNSEDKLRKSLGSDVKIDAVQEYNLSEWIELRDFFGIDGRKVVGKQGCFVPYWENLSEWASIPGERVENTRKLCQNFNKRLLELLDSQGYNISRIGKPIPKFWR